MSILKATYRDSKLLFYLLNTLFFRWQRTLRDWKIINYQPNFKRKKIQKGIPMNFYLYHTNSYLHKECFKKFWLDVRLWWVNDNTWKIILTRIFMKSRNAYLCEKYIANMYQENIIMLPPNIGLKAYSRVWSNFKQLKSL